jgi:hypothetical protein
MDTPNYIKDYEHREGILSRNTVVMPEGFDDFLKDKKVSIVYSESNSDFENGKISFKSKIYKTQQGFYLYLLFGDDGKTDMTIYYKQSQLSELTIFITQLFKQFKNATTNNKRTERKD